MAAWQTPINQLQGSAAGAPWPGTVPYWAPLPQCYGPMPPPPPFYGQPPMLPLPPSPLAYNHQSSALSPQQMELSGLSGEVKELESAIEMKQRDMKALLADTEQFGNPSPTTVSTADLELSVHVEQNSSPDPDLNAPSCGTQHLASDMSMEAEETLVTVNHSSHCTGEQQVTAVSQDEAVHRDGLALEQQSHPQQEEVVTEVNIISELPADLVNRQGMYWDALSLVAVDNEMKLRSHNQQLESAASEMNTMHRDTVARYEEQIFSMVTETTIYVHIVNAEIRGTEQKLQQQQQQILTLQQEQLSTQQHLHTERLKRLAVMEDQATLGNRLLELQADLATSREMQHIRGEEEEKQEASTLQHLGRELLLNQRLYLEAVGENKQLQENLQVVNTLRERDQHSQEEQHQAELTQQHARYVKRLQDIESTSKQGLQLEVQKSEVMQGDFQHQMEELRCHYEQQLQQVQDSRDRALEEYKTIIQDKDNELRHVQGQLGCLQEQSSGLEQQGCCGSLDMVGGSSLLSDVTGADLARDAAVSGGSHFCQDELLQHRWFSSTQPFQANDDAVVPTSVTPVDTGETSVIMPGIGESPEVSGTFRQKHLDRAKIVWRRLRRQSARASREQVKGSIGQLPCAVEPVSRLAIFPASEMCAALPLCSLQD